MRLSKVVFWDVDTQIDFIEPDGKLYVPGAELIKPNLGYLTKLGSKKTRLCGSVDAHIPDELEFAEWPSHCVYGTPGQLKIGETLGERTLFVPTAKLTESQLNEVVNFDSQILFEKQNVDLRSNPNIKPFLELARPERVIIYGVVSEICVDLSVEFFVGNQSYDTFVVIDAIKEIDMIKYKECKDNWKRMGVKLVKTKDVINLL
jgi:nicotinamidase/pyrazinamidase